MHSGCIHFQQVYDLDLKVKEKSLAAMKKNFGPDFNISPSINEIHVGIQEIYLFKKLESKTLRKWLHL